MKFTFETQHPVAYESFDHIEPKGTRQDVTRCMPFINKVEQLFQRKVVYADLGCSAGNIVEDFISRGHQAIGVEGSDFSQKHKREAWGTIPDNLFTADISKPFTVKNADTGEVVQFDIISAWEVMEHLFEDQLPSFCNNITKHLTAEGMFVCSVATFPDEGYHVTLKPREWWEQTFAANGLISIKTPFMRHEYARDSSFHLVLKKAT